MDNFFKTIQENQFAVGLLTTTILAAILAYLRNIPNYILEIIKRRIIVSCDIYSEDPLFDHICYWIHNLPSAKKTRAISVMLGNRRDYEDKDEDVFLLDENDNINKTKQKLLLFAPSLGTHLLFHKNWPFWFVRAQASEGGASYYQKRRETLSLVTFGITKTFLMSIIKEAAENVINPKNEHIRLFMNDSDSEFTLTGIRRKRNIDSVILPEGVMDALYSDMVHFLKSKPKYDLLGIPFRRGYLLHGKPGSGKTSTVLALASKLNADVYIINLGDSFFNDNKLRSLFSEVPPGAIILLEDIDGISRIKQEATQPSDDADDKDTREYSSTSLASTSTLTLSGLLNTIDGIASKDGRMLFMTTNFVEKLDPALIRPGRIDVKIKFGDATVNQIVKMIKRFCPELSKEAIEQFATSVVAHNISMAALQTYLIEYMDNSGGVLQNKDKLIELCSANFETLLTS